VRIQVCPLCGIDDFVKVVKSPDGETVYACAREKKHVDSPYLWTVDESGKDQRYPVEGLAADLNLFDDLRKCFDPEDGWVEYGILESRFRERAQDNFESVRAIYGSVLLDGPRKYSVASYVSRHVLSKLADWGEIDYSEGPATGIWKYTGSIGYWAKRPAPPRDQALTFASFVKGGSST
jgi:hypothetical protein